MKKKFSSIITFGILSAIFTASSAYAEQIDFTGGTVVLNNGTTATTNQNLLFQNVSHYIEDGFKFEFIFPDGTTPRAFASIIGDYYRTGNDVIHGHWNSNGNQNSGPFGEVIEMRISKVDGTTFDLGGFRVSTNTSRGGGFATGDELTWINSSKASEIFSITPDNWGLGSGPDPLITIAPANTLFDDITWFSFTNDPQSTAVGLGLDNFFLDEPGDPSGEDPTEPGDPTDTKVPEPASILGLLTVGVLGATTLKSKNRSLL